MKLILALVSAVMASAVTVPAPRYSALWSVSGPVDSAFLVDLTIVLKQRNIDQLKQIALAVSDPQSAEYGNFLTTDEIAELTRPSEEHRVAVTQWLDANGIGYQMQNEIVRVQAQASQLTELLSTKFMTLSHTSGKKVVRAHDYTIPTAVEDAIDTVLGLHGLPLPPKTPLVSAGNPAAVTPAVIYQTYDVPTISVNRQGQNQQAVAEFQDQFMNKADLVSFFKNEVKDAQPGDDQVYKFEGAPYTQGGSVEAALDIQFIMGVAVGVKTSFWELPSSDFCADLHNYTNLLLTTTDGPLVNSVSYGWQGDLSGIGCNPSDVTVVDTNFVKLAANGVTLCISSGDSGSGYDPSQVCEGTFGNSSLEITGGELLRTISGEAAQCCEYASQESAQGFTWYPPSMGKAQAEGFSNTLYSCEYSNVPKDFPIRDIYTLTGQLTTSGGNIQVHNGNGTFKDTTMDFGAEYTLGGEKFRNVSITVLVEGKHDSYKGRALFIDNECLEIEIFNGYTSQIVAIWRLGPNPPPPPPQGQCKLYKTVTATGSAPSGVISGGPAIRPSGSVQLWPSWPASSAWVTAVGATRFENQQVGQPEMASDQFGSGGGFSSMFDQSDAKWQQEAVAKYVAQGPSLPAFPPSNAFPATGRATPDVSGLGEGYQVYVSGTVEPVGGTSASSPMFAALITLINEERIAKGKKQLGYLNPFLYQNAAAFYDVVNGTNAISRGGSPLPYGYAAAPGWDAATGLGTPHFDKLLAAAMAN